MTNVLDLVAYKNGEYKPLGEIGPSILDFGFIHCDATYDVMPVYNGKAFCYDRHLQRFKNSAKRYGLTIPDVDPLEIIKELAKRNPIDNAFVWFLIWRGFPPSGNPRDLENCPVNFAMYIKPSYPIGTKTIINIALDETTNRVSDEYYGQEYKNMAWIELTMSQRNRPTGSDTTVLVDVDGHVTEGPGFNVGIVKNKVIYTADKNVLKGITMTVVEDIAQNNGIMFCRLPISQKEFNNADEVFITSSSGGVTATQKSGPVTEKLMTEYEKMKEVYGTLL
jgi:branched-chain amino acid aminotransferase|tara:strand:+ start:194 stop:1030 length:837 start_codon:yes stop_codon:yes gene_type:complete